VLLSPKFHKYAESVADKGERLKVMVEPTQIFWDFGMMLHGCSFNAKPFVKKNNNTKP
jgi:hypothetical protein